MKVAWSSPAWDEFEQWIADDLGAAKVIVGLVAYVRSGKTGKRLTRDLAGWSSLEIVGSHRLVHRLRERDGVQCLEILSCWGHYPKNRVF
jgi:Txe/YoeB family toxin of Txe-Axe toxin-antitoxin module